MRIAGPSIDFMSLSTLAIESCFYLHCAFQQFAARRATNLTAPHTIRLKSFYLRHEHRDHSVGLDIETFLCSFSGLEKLHVLLEIGSEAARPLAPLLRWHGETLKTLVWDQWYGPRIRAKITTTARPAILEHLRILSQRCPKPIALGITFDWNLLDQPYKPAQVFCSK